MSSKVPRRKNNILDVFDGLPKFDMETEVKVGNQIGEGSFGKVVQAKYITGKSFEKQAVIKSINSNEDYSRIFAKEAKLLHQVSIDKNKHIVEFIAVSQKPLAIMQELCSFDFRFFDDENVTYSLSQFINHVDAVYDYEGFTHIPKVIIESLIEGITYLHSKNIIHRDLKPANILVSNFKFQNMSIEEYCKQWEDENIRNIPIEIKITDFGESRSDLIQTLTILNSKVQKFDRGTPVYMAPELLLDELTSADRNDLKCADIWALGMVLWYVLNPNECHPLHQEIQEYKKINPMKINRREILKELLRLKISPKYTPKYAKYHTTVWENLRCMQVNLNKFDRSQRIKSIDSLRKYFSELEKVDITKVHLSCSQSTAVETFDKILAEQQIQQPDCIENDATNACCFLCVKIVEHLANFEIDSLDKIKQFSEDVILNLPLQLNHLRDITKFYDVVEAQKILYENNLTSRKLEFSEEITSETDIHSVAKGDELQAALFQILEKKQIAVYTCEPIVFIIFSYGESLSILDTHPVDKSVGGDGNGLFILFSGETKMSVVDAIMKWMQKRLILSVTKVPRQSLAVALYQDIPLSVGILQSADRKSKQPTVATITSSYSESNHLGRKEIVRESFENANGNADSGESKRKISSQAHVTNTEEYTSSEERTTNIENTPNETHTINSNRSSDSDSVIITCLREGGVPGVENGAKKVIGTKHDITNDGKIEQRRLQTEATISFFPDGNFYNGDPSLPVFLRTSNPFQWDEIVKILLENYEEEYLCTAPPLNISHNVSFLVDVSRLKCWDDLKCDDMGSWIHNGKPKKKVDVEFGLDGKIQRITSSKKMKNEEVHTREDECIKEEMILTRIYYKNKSYPDVRKVISSLKGSNHEKRKTVLVQYLFTEEEHTVDNLFSHGNSKKAVSYRRLLPSIIDGMKKSNKLGQPKKILDQIYLDVGDVEQARSIGELPRGPQDLYNARHNSSQHITRPHAENSAVPLDTLWCLMEKAKREDVKKGDLFIRDCRVHPTFFAVLAHNRQLEELQQFCTNPVGFCVLGIDPTFNIFEDNLSLTVTTYKNLKLASKETKKPPVFLGPLLIHQKKDWKTYSKFVHCLITEHPPLAGLLACGTDGEVSLIDGLKRNFHWATFLRCFIHVRKNIERELSQRKFSGEHKRLFMSEIFGKQIESTKYMGLVDCTTEEDFETKLQNLESVWSEREKERNTSGNSFYEWFVKHQAQSMKESMLSSVRTEAGLGDPPSEYTNNDTEAGNFMVKHSLNFDPKSPHEFIDAIRELINQQFRFEDRAVFGKGPYTINDRFKNFQVSDSQWSRLTHDQKNGKICAFINAGMEAAEELKQSRCSLNEVVATGSLSITAEESGIATVPLAILQTMFSKAEELIQEEGMVIPSPGADNGSFIVGGPSNKVFIVTPGRGNELRCDKECSNKSSKICEHILAVAQKKDQLKEFINWYKKSKSGASFTGMAMASGKSNIGKKKSSRKITNNKKPVATSYVDMLQTEADLNVNFNDFQVLQSLNGINPNRLQPQTIEKQNFPNQNSQPMPHCSFQGFNLGNPQMQSTLQEATFPRIMTGLGLPSFSQTQQPSPSFNQSQLQSQSRVISSISMPENVNLKGKEILNGFSLKWVQGTTVSACYGCETPIVNPPVTVLQQFCVVHRNYREHRNPLTGQKVMSEKKVNIHFHTNVSCIQKRYRDFTPQSLIVPGHVFNFLSAEHYTHLQNEFGISL